MHTHYVYMYKADKQSHLSGLCSLCVAHCSNSLAPLARVLAPFLA
jgi:hypothetical protein